MAPDLSIIQLSILGLCLIIGLLSGGIFSHKRKVINLDPRDQKIRSLEADLRVVKTDAEKSQKKIEEHKQSIALAEQEAERLDSQISDHQSTILQLKKMLKDSIKETRNLRNQLSEFATKSIKSSVAIKDKKAALKRDPELMPEDELLAHPEIDMAEVFQES